MDESPASKFNHVSCHGTESVESLRRKKRIQWKSFLRDTDNEEQELLWHSVYD